ncbi:MAG: DNA-binding protein WhiA [Bacilli bacterium]
MATKEMAFAKKVKNEISLNSYSKEEKKYVLSGFARNGGSFSIGSKPSLSLHTEIACVAKLLYSCLKECYSLAPTIRYENVSRFGRGLVYEVFVEDKRLYDVMEDLEIMKDGIERIPPSKGLHRKNLKFLVVGSFLANGSVNNPSSGKTSYFLEMAFSDKADANAVRRKLNSFKEEKTMLFKYIKRRDKHVLYLKKSDQISVFLSYIGAVESMLDFENARVLKDDMNINNRLSICDSANYGKTLLVAKKDVEDIELVLSVTPLGLFDSKTQLFIEKRLEMKDSNYRELAETMTEEGISITKSGVVHLMTSLREKAAQIRERNKK